MKLIVATIAVAVFTQAGLAAPGSSPPRCPALNIGAKGTAFCSAFLHLPRTSTVTSTTTTVRTSTSTKLTTPPQKVTTVTSTGTSTSSVTATVTTQARDATAIVTDYSTITLTTTVVPLRARSNQERPKEWAQSGLAAVSSLCSCYVTASTTTISSTRTLSTSIKTTSTVELPLKTLTVLASTTTTTTVIKTVTNPPTSTSISTTTSVATSTATEIGGPVEMCRKKYTRKQTDYIVITFGGPYTENGCLEYCAEVPNCQSISYDPDADITQPNNNFCLGYSVSASVATVGYVADPNGRYVYSDVTCPLN